MSLRIAAEYLGWRYEQDFVLGVGDDDLRWTFSPHPTEADLRAVELPAMRAWKRAQARAWLTAINGRAYEHAGNSEDFDDVIFAVRTGCRNMINNWAAEAALTPRVSVAEAKAAFAAAAPQFDLIDKAKAGKILVVAEINALPDVPSIEAYQVTDAVVAAAWATANPSVTPTLGELLVQFPVRTEE